MEKLKCFGFCLMCVYSCVKYFEDVKRFYFELIVFRVFFFKCRVIGIKYFVLGEYLKVVFYLEWRVCWILSYF